jgi:hypothetical protein
MNHPFFKKDDSFSKTRFKTRYFFSKTIIKNFYTKFLYRFFLNRQKYKLLNSVNSIKIFRLKKIYLKPKKLKNIKLKNIKLKKKDFLKFFRKYQFFKSFKLTTRKAIPNFFLFKKK